MRKKHSNLVFGLLPAAMALITLSLNAQLKADKNAVVWQQASTEKFATPADGFFRSGPSRESTTPVVPPYSNGFNSQDEWNWWEVINANGDNKTWFLYETRAVYTLSDYAADDWLVTAPVFLQAGKTYKFYIDTWAGSYSERLEVKLASSNTAEALSAGTTVIAPTTVIYGDTITLRNEHVTVSTSGYYYFGIHAISDANKYHLDVDNFFIDVETIPETPPYSNSFETLDEWYWWKIIDVNGDGNESGYGNGTWTRNLLGNSSTGFNYYASYFHGETVADDWLVTSPIALEAGKTYVITFDDIDSYNDARIEVMMASGQTAEDLSNGTTIIAPTYIDNTTTIRNENVTVSSDGIYYIGVHVISNPDQCIVNVGNFTIGFPVHDLSVSLNAPSTADTGSTPTVTATVTNNGNSTETGYTVTITANGTTIVTHTASEPLKPGESATFTAQYTTTDADAGQTVDFAANVACTVDSDASNDNATASTSVITMPDPENVAVMLGTHQSATMTWDAPNIPTAPTVTEDFEDTGLFPSFSIGGLTSTIHTGTIGGWTVYDPSGLSVSRFRMPYDNAGKPQAWTVFNPTSAYITYQTTHSGEQIMVSFCVNQEDDNGDIPATNHWLISPELSGNAQTITYWDRAVNADYGTETYEVWISTTDNNPASFEKQEEFSCTSHTEWTQRSVTLPAGTRYFAIRHNSTDVFGLAIDDVTYESCVPGVLCVSPVSYNIYLDGNLVGNVDSDIFSYSFSDLVPGEHQGAVSAVYPNGMESSPVPATFTVESSLVVFDPVMLPADEDYITRISFRADWTDQTVAENVVSYTLEVAEKPTCALIVEMDWSDATFSADPANFLPEGWSCDRNVYSADGNLTISQNNGVFSPQFDFTGYDKMTVVIRAHSPFSWEREYITVTTSVDSKRVAFTDEYSDSTIVLNCSDLDNIRFDNSGPNFIEVKSIKIYAGDLTAQQLNATVEEGGETYRLITGITDKSYTVNDLVAGGTYLYKVKALYTDGEESAWSKKEMVTLLGFTRGDVNCDGNVNISDVTALINYLLTFNAEGLNLEAADCNQDNNVNIRDVTTMINYLLNGSWN